MKINDILDEWKADSHIDSYDLSKEALNIAKLHHKYHQFHTEEKLLLRKCESDLRKLKLSKYEFYTQGPHEETPKDWIMPASGKILKNEVETYLEADKELNDLVLKVNLQQEKVDLLKSIISSINQRTFVIKNFIDYEKFKAGA